jgi:hypothetical protein
LEPHCSSGSWGSQAIQYFWDRKKTRSGKLQELVSAVYDADHWLDRKQTYRVFGVGTDPVDCSPLGKAQTIATVYFTRLTKDIDTFASAVRVYEMWQTRVELLPIASQFSMNVSFHFATFAYENRQNARRSMPPLIGPS